MSEKTLYFVQPYVVRRSKLVASGALTFMHREEALATGEGLARRRAGIVVLAQSYDPERHTMMPPRVMRVYGRVPSEWTASRLAA
jgi:hypothetical protein